MSLKLTGVRDVGFRSYALIQGRAWAKLRSFEGVTSYNARGGLFTSRQRRDRQSQDRRDWCRCMPI